MRYDLTIYWVEDTPSWGESAKDLLNEHLIDSGLAINFVVEKDVHNAEIEIANSCKGFKKYDLFFVDYNIATSTLAEKTDNNICGKDIIKSLRDFDIDVDILFYSAHSEKEIRDAVIANLSSYEGVYIANRESFQEKALALIEKNVRRLLSIKNIRGMLMDSTSENDFIINSYIIEMYPKLDEEKRSIVDEFIINYITKYVRPYAKEIEDKYVELTTKGITNISKFMKLPSYILPLKLKYLLFEEIMVLNGGNKARYDGYFNSVVKNRNTLAHKKIDICDNLDHIKYCDTLAQFKCRMCDETKSCATCEQEATISMDDWNRIRKQVVTFSYVFDDILSKLLQ